METQFARTELLLGKENMEKLADARVCIFGIGGVGGYVAEALARSGVGHLELVDNDVVALALISAVKDRLDDFLHVPRNFRKENDLRTGCNTDVESDISGVNRALKPFERLWYRRNFTLDGFDHVQGGAGAFIKDATK